MRTALWIISALSAIGMIGLVGIATILILDGADHRCADHANWECGE